MKRTRYIDLLAWKARQQRKPLILDGARQTGKTWLMKHFAEHEYESSLYINFDHPEYLNYHRIFTQGNTPARIIELLELESGKAIDEGRTLLIFDEIQEVPAALAGLKYFHEELPGMHIVCAGSQMGIALHQGTSFPVGNVETIKLLPLSFVEFLQATGNERFAVPLEDNCPELTVELHEHYLHLLQTYLAIGGMPEAVQRFSQGEQPASIRELHYQLLDNYRADFSKHAPANLISKLNLVWDSVPRQLAKENKKYLWSRIRKGARAAEFENAIQWLEDCGLVYKLRQLDTPLYPLESYASPDVFKVYPLDVGLLGAQAGTEMSMLLGSDGALGAYREFKGSLAEQFALQELRQHHRHLYYWTGAASEVDFVLQREGEAVPIEVKSGENLQAKSLRAFQDKYHPPCAYKLSLLPYKDNGALINMPLYLAGLV